MEDTEHVLDIIYLTPKMRIVIGEYQINSTSITFGFGILTERGGNVIVDIDSGSDNVSRILKCLPNRFNPTVISIVISGIISEVKLTAVSDNNETAEASFFPIKSPETIYFASCDSDWKNQRLDTPYSFRPFSNHKGKHVMWGLINAQKDTNTPHIYIHHGDQIYADEIFSHIEWYSAEQDICVFKGEITEAEKNKTVYEYAFKLYCEVYTKHWMDREVLSITSNIFLPNNHDVCDSFNTFGVWKYPKDDPMVKAAMDACMEFQQSSRITRGPNLSYLQLFDELAIVYIDTRTDVDLKTGDSMSATHFEQIESYFKSIPSETKRIIVVLPRAIYNSSLTSYLGSMVIAYAQNNPFPTCNRSQMEKIVGLMYEQRKLGCSIVMIGGDIHETLAGRLYKESELVCQIIITSGVSQKATCEAPYMEQLTKGITWVVLSRMYRGFCNKYKYYFNFRNTTNNIARIVVGDGWKCEIFCNGIFSRPTHTVELK